MLHYISPVFLSGRKNADIESQLLRANGFRGTEGFTVQSGDTKEVVWEMPIYEYQCEQCGSVEEALQKISDKPLTKCPRCSGKLHKLISHSSFHLKGTGWYVTDYAGKTQAQGKDGDTGAPPKKTESSESKPSSAKTADSTD